MSNLYFDLSADLKPAAAAEVDAGGKLTVPGWYLCRVKKIEPNEQMTKLNFQFDVAAGPQKGAVVYQSETLMSAALGEEENEKLAKRLRFYALRLELWSGRPEDPLTFNLADAVGKLVVLECAGRTYQDAAGATKHVFGMTYSGIYPPTHEKIPPDVRKALGLPAAKPRAAEAAGPQKSLFELAAEAVASQPAATPQPPPSSTNYGAL